MKKQFIGIFLALALVLSNVPNVSSADSKIQTLDNAVDVIKVINSNKVKTHGTKVSKDDINNELMRRVMMKSDIAPVNTYGADKTFYYSNGGYYILEYSDAKIAGKAVKHLKEDYPKAIVVQDRAVKINTEANSKDCEPKVFERKKISSNKVILNKMVAKTKAPDPESEEFNKYAPFPYNGEKSMGLNELKKEKIWGDKDIQVAVIDSGIVKDHKYFKNRLNKTDSINVARDFNDGVGSDVDKYDDDYGHGSHVAGIITKSTPENVKIMAIRVFDVTRTASLSTINTGIHHAIEKKADIINLSLGQLKINEEEESFINEAMGKAVKNKCTCLVAAGNELMNVEGSFPASNGWGITIGSYEEKGKKIDNKKDAEQENPIVFEDQNNEDFSVTNPPSYDEKKYMHSYFSNYGDRVDFAAPGRYIKSAWALPSGGLKDPETGKPLDIDPNEMETVSSGTSMSTPYMAAAAAYIKLRHPEYSQNDVYSTFLDYTKDIGKAGKDDYFGNGYVNMKDYAKHEKDPKTFAGKRHQVLELTQHILTDTSRMEKGVSFTAKNLSKGGNLHISKDDAGILQIKGNKIYPKKAGKTAIKVTADATDEYAKTTHKIRVVVRKGMQEVVPEKKSYIKYRNDKPFYIKAKVKKPGDGKIEYIANDNNVAKVYSNGLIKIKGPGKINVYAKALSTKNFKSGKSEAIKITILAKKNPKLNKVKLAKVTKLKAKAKKKRKINLSWAKVKKAKGYKIYVSGKVYTCKGNKYVLRKLKKNKTYKIKVRAFVKEGKKTWYGSYSRFIKVKVKR